MSNKTLYWVNGEEVSNLNEVAKLLGVSRKDITLEGILEGRFPEVMIVPESDEEVDDLVASTSEEEEAINEGTDEESLETEDTEDEDTTEDTNTPESFAGDLAPEGGYPEAGSFKTKKDLQKYIKKQMSTAQLEDWCNLEGVLSNIKPTDHEGIWRMRLAMAVCEIHYPTDKKPSAGKSKYADLTTEQLVDMAREAGVTVKDAKGDTRIQRMYTIMALREEGYLQ